MVVEKSTMKLKKGLEETFFPQMQAYADMSAEEFQKETLKDSGEKISLEEAERRQAELRKNLATIDISRPERLTPRRLTADDMEKRLAEHFAKNPERYGRGPFKLDELDRKLLDRAGPSEAMAQARINAALNPMTPTQRAEYEVNRSTVEFMTDRLSEAASEIASLFSFGDDTKQPASTTINAPVNNISNSSATTVTSTPIVPGNMSLQAMRQASSS